MSSPAPLPAVSIPADAVPAAIVSHLSHIVQVKVDDRLYDYVTVSCACRSLEMFYHRPAKATIGRLYSRCPVHGDADCGLARRAARCLASRNLDRQLERRRQSGGTTERWHQARRLS